MSFIIELLTSTDLQSALKLQHENFQDLTPNEKLTLQASLESNNFLELYKKENIDSMKYFVGKVDGEVIGLIGVYTERDDKSQSAWLGWFCVDENFRGLGYGKNLLDFAILQVKEKKSLKLYCYDSKEYEVALAMYKKYGFSEYKREDNYIYLEKRVIK